jgi:hypothetical protein
MLMSQGLSLNATSAPVPGSLWENAVSRLSNVRFGSRRVTVKDSHVDSGTRWLKFVGLPNEASSLAAREAMPLPIRYA